MKQDDFQKYVLEKLDSIEDKVNGLSDRMTRLEVTWSWIKRLGLILLIVVLTKWGVDLSGLHL